MMVKFNLKLGGSGSVTLFVHPPVKPTRDKPKSAILRRRLLGSIRILAGFKSLLTFPNNWNQAETSNIYSAET